MYALQLQVYYVACFTCLSAVVIIAFCISVAHVGFMTMLSDSWLKKVVHCCHRWMWNCCSTEYIHWYVIVLCRSPRITSRTCCQFFFGQTSENFRARQVCSYADCITLLSCITKCCFNHLYDQLKLMDFPMTVIMWLEV